MIFMDETKKVDFITDKWISLRTSGFVNLLVRRSSRFFDEIRALDIIINHSVLSKCGGGPSRWAAVLPATASDSTQTPASIADASWRAHDGTGLLPADSNQHQQQQPQSLPHHPIVSKIKIIKSIDLFTQINIALWTKYCTPSPLSITSRATEARGWGRPAAALSTADVT